MTPQDPGSATRDEEPVDTFDDTTLPSESGIPAPIAGWIKKIKLTNFMCHASTEVEMIRNVNFITGQNGSKFYIYPNSIFPDC